jgi:hypothetical protein
MLHRRWATYLVVSGIGRLWCGQLTGAAEIRWSCGDHFAGVPWWRNWRWQVKECHRSQLQAKLTQVTVTRHAVLCSSQYQRPADLPITKAHGSSTSQKRPHQFMIIHSLQPSNTSVVTLMMKIVMISMMMMVMMIIIISRRCCLLKTLSLAWLVKISLPFIEPWSKMTANWHSVSVQSSKHAHILFLQVANIILPFTPRSPQ